jgi:hypothetical protein
MTTIEVDESALQTEPAEERIQREVAPPAFNKKFVEDLLDKLMIVVDELSGVELYGYQRPFARRMLNSLITNDGATLTALFSRQSGKSETVANTIVCAMVMLPRLAKIYPEVLGKFKRGLWVGAFAPTDGQTDIIFGRIVSRLSSDLATEFLQDPEIADRLVKVSGKVPTFKLKNCNSFVSRQTAHPKAKIEGRTYHIILIDECQDADEHVVNKSINPMGASTNATRVYIGTPTYTKGVFYRQIQINKREGTRRGTKTNHFEADWKEVAKWNFNYKKFVEAEMARIGEDSDEFRLSYRLHWLLDKGMFTTSEILDGLEDTSMEMVLAWHKSPVVVGIDPARKQDSTIVTVVWVDWDHPDPETGFYNHRILAWLDLENEKWEAQYVRIVEFLSNYSIFSIGVDEGGLGDVVIDRLRNLMPHIPIEPVGSSRPEQSKRWKHLMQLFARQAIGWPGHSKTKRLKIWKRFRQQFEDLELHYEGPHVVAAAPKEAGAHDDYCDSLAIACVMTEGYTAPMVEVASNPFYGR